jgi:hypothetical protein
VGVLVVIGDPVVVDDLELGPVAEDLGGGAGEHRQVALLDPGADVLGRAHEQARAAAGGQLERVEPDVEGQVRDFGAQFAPDSVPGAGEFVVGRGWDVFGHGGTAALRAAVANC